MLESPSIEKIIERCWGAYAETTLRGYGADLRSFESWCARRNRHWLPAEADTVAAFIDHETETLSASTLKRRTAAINFAHRMADLPSPTAASAVHLALRRASRRKSRRPAQATGLTSEMLNRITGALPKALA